MSTADYRPEPVQGSSVSTPARRDPAAKTIAEPICYRLRELPEALGVSLRAIERERAAGRFPKPDRMIGRSPIWLRQAIVEWIANATPSKPSRRGGGR